MAAAGPSVGHKMKMYRSTGSVATPAWALVSEVGDVSIPDLSMGLAELKRRASNFTKNLPTLIQSISVEFRLHHGLDSTTFTALRTAFFLGTPSEWAIADQAIATVGTEALRCPFLIEQFPWDQPLEEVNGHDVRLAVAYMLDGVTEVDPSWMVVAGS
jgi:hypothetical protein